MLTSSYWKWGFPVVHRVAKKWFSDARFHHAWCRQATWGWVFGLIFTGNLLGSLGFSWFFTGAVVLLSSAFWLLFPARAMVTGFVVAVLMVVLAGALALPWWPSDNVRLPALEAVQLAALGLGALGTMALLWLNHRSASMGRLIKRSAQDAKILQMLSAGNVYVPLKPEDVECLFDWELSCWLHVASPASRSRHLQERLETLEAPLAPPPPRKRL